MPKFMTKMALLAKIQTVLGTDPIPTGAANAMFVKEVTLTPLDGDMVQRDMEKPYWGNDGDVQVTAYGRVQFKIECAGAGAAGTVPKYDPLMRMCSHSATTSAGVSVAYSPITDNLEYGTLYGVIDGVIHKMTDAQGAVKLGMTAKGFPMWEYDFMAPFLPLTDGAMPVPVYTGFTKPVAVNKANTIATLHGLVVAMSDFSWDAGNKLVKRDLTAVDSVLITGRSASGSITFENTSVAVKDWIGQAKATAQGNLNIVHGTVAGNIIEFNSAGRCQISKPAYSKQDGVQMLTLQNGYIPSTAGNDEYSWIVR